MYKRQGVSFQACAGFSLGEYTALAASGIVSLADGVKIVRKRGQVMQQAADSMDSGMAAILGLDDAVVEEACAKVTSGIVRCLLYTSLARRNANLFANQVHAGHLLGHRMLDLNAGIHLAEIEVLVFIGQEFDRARAAVSDFARQIGCRGTDACAETVSYTHLCTKYPDRGLETTYPSARS